MSPSYRESCPVLGAYGIKSVKTQRKKTGNIAPNKTLREKPKHENISQIQKSPPEPWKCYAKDEKKQPISPTVP